MRARGLMGLFVAAALLVAACGEDDKVTKADYLKQANALCKTMNTQMKAVADPGNDPKKTADAYDQSHAIVGTTLTKLRDLPRPDGDEAEIGLIYAKVDRLQVDTVAAVKALRANEIDKANHLIDQINQDGKDANKASTDYGLTECAK